MQSEQTSKQTTAQSEQAAAKVLGEVALHLQDLVLENPKIELFLNQLAEYTAARFSGPGQELLCAISLFRRKRGTTVAGNNPGARLMDQAQVDCGDGPCLTAARDLVTVQVPELSGEQRWPEFTESAGQDVGSLIAVPLRLQGENRAAMSLYFREPNAFSRMTLSRVEAYAGQASKSLRLAVNLAQLQEAKDNLVAAMESRIVIHLATGAIMAQNRCGQETAFGILRRASIARNEKLNEVAAGVVASLSDAPVATHFDD